MADQFYDNIPAVANAIADDIDQIEKTLGYIEDVFENFVGTWSDTDKSLVYPAKTATGSSGATADTTADDYVFEGSAANVGISILTTDTGTSGIHMGDATAPGTVKIISDNANDLFYIFNGSAYVKYTSDGDLLMGTLSGPATNKGNVLVFDTRANDPTMSANTAGLYAKDVSSKAEMFAMDEDDNATQLSPHDFELFDPPDDVELPWSYSSENKQLGKKINVDMAGAIRELERISGKQFIYYKDVERVDTVRQKKDAWKELWKMQNNSRSDDQAEQAAKSGFRYKQPKWIKDRLKED